MSTVTAPHPRTNQQPTRRTDTHHGPPRLGRYTDHHSGATREIDAEMIAAQFGTRPANDITHQIDYASGISEKGSIRRVDKFHVHPNEFREFVPGQAAIKCVAHQRYTIVRVYLDTPDTLRRRQL
jgi:hypothetical protein